MYKLKSPSMDNVLSIGFHRSLETRERELTKNKTIKGNYHVRILSKGVFGFAEDP